MRQSAQIMTFWQTYLETLSDDQRLDLEYLVYDFGNSKEMADELGYLVKTGVKTAPSILLNCPIRS